MKNNPELHVTKKESGCLYFAGIYTLTDMDVYLAGNGKTVGAQISFDGVISLPSERITIGFGGCRVAEMSLFGGDVNFYRNTPLEGALESEEALALTTVPLAVLDDVFGLLRPGLYRDQKVVNR